MVVVKFNSIRYKKKYFGQLNFFTGIFKFSIFHKLNSYLTNKLINFSLVKFLFFQPRIFWVIFCLIRRSIEYHNCRCPTASHGMIISLFILYISRGFRVFCVE